MKKVWVVQLNDTVKGIWWNWSDALKQANGIMSQTYKEDWSKLDKGWFIHEKTNSDLTIRWHKVL